MGLISSRCVVRTIPRLSKYLAAATASKLPTSPLRTLRDKFLIAAQSPRPARLMCSDWLNIFAATISFHVRPERRYAICP